MNAADSTGDEIGIRFDCIENSEFDKRGTLDVSECQSRLPSLGTDRQAKELYLR